MRFLLTPAGGSRPSLVVDTVPVIDEAAIGALRADMHGLGCAHGILFDAERCVILRDTFENMDASSIVVDGDPLSTVDVLGPFGHETLDRGIERWLSVLSTNWNRALSAEPRIAAPFITDIVPAASGSVVHAIGSGR